MQLGIAEILRKTSDLKTEEEQINFLRKNYSKPLIEVLGHALDPTIVWLLPPGKVPYKPNKDLLDQEGLLYSEARKFYLFCEYNGKVGHPTLTKTKRETLYVNLLTNLAPEDAELLEAIKDKKLPYNLKFETIKAAFPGFMQNFDKPADPITDDEETTVVETKPKTTKTKTGGTKKVTKNEQI